jgi:hypothetical protein
MIETREVLQLMFLPPPALTVAKLTNAEIRRAYAALSNQDAVHVAAQVQRLVDQLGGDGPDALTPDDCLRLLASIGKLLVEQETK